MSSGIALALAIYSTAGLFFIVVVVIFRVAKNTEAGSRDD